MPLITCTNLTSSYNNADQTSYTTASVTLTAGKLHLIGIVSRHNSATTTATLSGVGTWEEAYTHINTVNTLRVSLFACVPSADSTGSITIDFAGVTQVGCCWSLEQFTNAAVGPTGTSSLVQVDGATALSSSTSVSVTLGSFSHVQNATYGFGAVQLNEVMAPGSGFSTTAQANGASPNLAFLGEFRNDNDTVVDMSWTTSNLNTVIVAAEIAHSPYPKIISV